MTKSTGGASDSNPIAAPNPRLEMLIDAARRGAQVRIQFDSFFDNTQSLRNNQATVDSLHTLAAAASSSMTTSIAALQHTVAF